MNNWWLQFEIGCISTEGKQIVQYRLTCSSSLDPVQPERCHLIEMTCKVGRINKTVSIRKAAICAQDIPLGWHSYRGGSLSAVVQQTPEAEKETYIVRHLPGPPLISSCRLNPLLSDVEAWRYMATNMDVAEAVQADPVGARAHYRDYGRYEGRSFSFEPLSYLASHPDLDVFGEDEIAACRHFIDHGHRENRSILFNPTQYLDRNSDLAAALGVDKRAASLHFLRHGRYEGRAT